MGEFWRQLIKRRFKLFIMSKFHQNSGVFSAVPTLFDILLSDHEFQQFRS